MIISMPCFLILIVDKLVAIRFVSADYLLPSVGINIGQHFPNGGLRPGTGSRKPTAGSPKYCYLILNFIIMSRVSS